MPIARDAALWNGAVVAPATTFVPHAWRTSLAFHLGDAFAGALAAFARAGPVWAVVVACSLVGIARTRERTTRALWFGAVACYAFAPFGFENGTPQFANGQSFRFALPAIAIGIVAFARSRAISHRAVPWIAGLACAFGVAEWWRIFATDAMTFGTPGFVAIAIVATTRGRPSRSGIAVPFAFVAAAVVAAVMNGTRPIAYVAERYGAPGRPSGAFAWLASHDARRVVAFELPAGAIVTAIPAADVGDAAEGSVACAQAARLGALLVTTSAVERRRVCGRRRYRDGSLAVDDPSALAAPATPRFATDAASNRAAPSPSTIHQRSPTFG